MYIYLRAGVLSSSSSESATAFSLSSEAISKGPFSTAGGDGGIIVFDEENAPVDEAGIFGESLISKLPIYVYTSMIIILIFKLSLQL
jgi:hypothetical protein